MDRVSVAALSKAADAPAPDRPTLVPAILRAFAGFALTLVLLELAARAYGLHQPVIFEKTEYGYRAAPSQNLKRFGNRVYYNDAGLRSEPFAPRPAAGTLRVLCVGDSVTNGGALTDQAVTYPYRLRALLGERLQRVEVLNASAPGWAVANELGWLRREGVLNSAFVVLLLSGHDLFQDMAPAAVVGTHPSFPEKRPAFALQDIMEHYVLPRLLSVALEDPGVVDVVATKAAARHNLEDVLEFEARVRRAGARLVVVYLHEEQRGDFAPVEREAEEQLFAALGTRGIRPLTLEAAIGLRGRRAFYRDAVHPNAAGNHAIAQEVARHILAATASSGDSAQRKQSP